MKKKKLLEWFYCMTYLIRLLDIDWERDWDLFLSIDPERERDLEWAGDLKTYTSNINNKNKNKKVYITIGLNSIFNQIK